MKYESSEHLCLTLYKKAVEELRYYGFDGIEEY